MSSDDVPTCTSFSMKPCFWLGLDGAAIWIFYFQENISMCLFELN